MDAHNYRFGRVTERTLILAVEVGIYSLYFPISHYVINLSPVDVSTAFDRALPLWPSWIFIYVAIFYTAFLPLFLVKDRLVFRRVALCYIVVESTAMLIFLLLPVQMTIRPEIASLAGDDFITWGLKLCYFVDLPVNCFPSLHVANAMLGALACLKVDRWVGAISFAVGILIVASTMLVKQHFLADVIAGGLMATAAYWFILRPVRTDHLSMDQLRYSRWPSAMVAISYFITILGCYGLYLSGWTPWAS